MKKFAVLDFIDSNDEIPYKFKIFKNSNFNEWYVRKFNPYIKTEFYLDEVEGYRIKMPIPKQYVMENVELSNFILKKTISDLKLENINCGYFENDKYKLDEDNLFFTKGKIIKEFFVMDIIEKSLNILEKDLKSAEILLLGNNVSEIESVLEIIYPNVNFLNIILLDDDISVMKEKINYIFNETGLNVGVFNKNKYLISNADIIINFSNTLENFVWAPKKGAILLDLSENENGFIEFCQIRNDVFALDNFDITYKNKTLRLKEFESILYLYENMFRHLCRYKRSNNAGLEGLQLIKKYDVKVNKLYKHNIALNSRYYIDFKSKFKDKKI